MTPEPHRLSADQARRIAVRAQLLEAPRPTDALDVVRHLTSVQADDTAAVVPSADLVLWGRLGSAYRVGDLRRLADDGALVELDGRLTPVDDVALHRADMDAWPGPEPLKDWEESLRAWVLANDACRRDVLERLRQDGPLPVGELPDTCEVPWRSSGWNAGRNVRRLLALMEQRGEVAVAGRDGRDRLWDLAERIHPDVPAVPAEDARRERDDRRLRALGIARGGARVVPGERVDVGDAGEPAVVDGVRGRWRVDPDLVAAADEPLDGRTVLLSPLDRLVVDRKRLGEVFDFDYQLEMYKPAAKRRWGYWAMPVLHGDRLVGKVDATADHEAGRLWIDAVHHDVPFDDALTGAVDAEVHALAAWLGLAATPTSPTR